MNRQNHSLISEFSLKNINFPFYLANDFEQQLSPIEHHSDIGFTLASYPPITDNSQQISSSSNRAQQPQAPSAPSGVSSSLRSLIVS